MPESAYTVECECTIARPLDVVREQFFDVDHAVRSSMHEALRLRWLPARAPGERRVLQETRLLGVAQADELLVEDDDGGALRKRFVGGPREGAVVRYAFEPAGEGHTRVCVTGSFSASGLHAAFGPLYRFALRRELERELSARRRDLEAGYTPGRARGDLSRALTALEPVAARARALEGDAERVSLLTPVLEAACVTAIADDHVDDAERDALHAVLRALAIPALDADAVDAVIASSVDRARAEGLERRCDALGAQLRALDLVNAGMSAATLVAQISHGVDERELATLRRIATAAGMDDTALAALLERVERQLSRTPR